MKVEPKVPGAPAILLSYEENNDPVSGRVLIHQRIKVLTEAGLSEGTIELPGYFSFLEDVSDIFSARVIHTDGTVIPYQLKPEKNAHLVNGVATISLPGIETGCIIETFLQGVHAKTLFRLFGYGSYGWFYEPYWAVQHKYFTKAAHYNMDWPEGLEDSDVQWVAHLPENAHLRTEKHHVILDVQDVPAAPHESFMPPLRSLIYGVDFYFYGKVGDYWGKTSGDNEGYIKNALNPGKNVRSYVATLYKPEDTEEQKLRSIYASVQFMENSNFTRERSKQEEKKNGERTGSSSDDLLSRKRGTSRELTELFIAMARAAGLKAYPFFITPNDEDRFQQSRLSWYQLDGMLAMVRLGKTELLLDPGTPFCPFGTLAPNHLGAGGLIIEESTVVFRTSPQLEDKLIPSIRVMSVKLSSDGSVTGKLQTAISGLYAMHLRQLSLKQDDEALRASIEKEFTTQTPSGLVLHVLKMDNMKDISKPINLTFDVSGQLATVTAHRLIMPAFPLETRATTDLPHIARITPLQFPSPYYNQDLINIDLPDGYKVESLPKSNHLRLGESYAEYVSLAAQDTKTPSRVTMKRIDALALTSYSQASYNDISGYFEHLVQDDQQIITLTKEPSTAASPSAHP